jgi:hypothetical protein
LSSPGFYAKGASARVTAANVRLEELGKKLDEAYQRWLELFVAFIITGGKLLIRLFSRGNIFFQVAHTLFPFTAIG